MEKIRKDLIIICSILLLFAAKGIIYIKLLLGGSYEDLYRSYAIFGVACLFVFLTLKGFKWFKYIFSLILIVYGLFNFIEAIKLIPRDILVPFVPLLGIPYILFFIIGNIYFVFSGIYIISTMHKKSSEHKSLVNNIPSNKKKRLNIYGYILFFLIIIFVLNMMGYLAVFNSPLNNLIAGKVDVSCQTERDCQITLTDCTSCEGEARNANRKWERFCPFKDLRNTCVISAEYLPRVSKCIDNECQLIWKNESGDILDCGYACRNAGYSYYSSNCTSQSVSAMEKYNMFPIGRCTNREEKCFCGR